jgi:hypothetical protein
MPVKRGNRTKKSVKNRAKGKRLALKRRRTRHQKSVKRSKQARC